MEKLAMKLTHSLFITASLLSIAFPILAADMPKDISGNYLCMGDDASKKSPYEKVPLVVTKNGDVLSFRWDFSSQKMGIILGLGIPNVNQPNVIAGVFWDSKATTNIGVITYQVKPDGSLSGNWAIPGGTAWGLESCTKTS